MIIIETNQSVETKNAAEILRERNEDWRKKYSPVFFENLAKGQSPQVLFIACSDSRVTPSVISQSNLGEIFEFRNIANVALPSDLNIKALLSFALLHLKIKHVVVCGHYECGGVNAAMDFVENGLELDQALTAHLAPIVSVYHENSARLKAIADRALRHQALVELNVLKQVDNLRSLDFVEKMRKEVGVQLPMFHGAVFDITQGKLKIISKPTELETISHVKARIANELSRLSHYATSYNPFHFIGAGDKHKAIQEALASIDTDDDLLTAIKDPSSALYKALNQKRLLPVTFLSFSHGFSYDAESLHKVKQILPEVADDVWTSRSVCC